MSPLARRVNAADRALERLWEWATARRIFLNRRQQQQIREYLDALLVWNRRVALVSQNDPWVVLCKHFADSLVAGAYCDPTATVVDMGTGAGFPGLVIAIAQPTARVTLIESKQKKISFLFQVISAARVENARVVAARIESAVRDPQQAGRYSLAISRALSDLRGFLDLAAPFLPMAGTAVAMKGPAFRAELRLLSESDLKRAGFAPPHAYRYELPDGAKRVLLSFRRL